MDSRTFRLVGAVFVVLFAMAPWVSGGEPPAPGPSDRCPVCGMFVAKYPSWVAAVVFDDATTVFFDGPKDLFRYLLDRKTYDKGRARSEIADVFVTDYYTTRTIKAQSAYFVVGSDVVGPMGAELVAVSGEENAQVFLNDHRGEKILEFDEITLEILPK